MPVIFIFRDRFKKLLSEDERQYLHHTYTMYWYEGMYHTHAICGSPSRQESLQGPLSRFREYLLHH